MRITAGFHAVSPSRARSDTADEALPLLREGDCPRQQVWGPVSSPTRGRSWAKGSSRGAVGTGWDGAGNARTPGARLHSPGTAVWHGGRAGPWLRRHVPGVLLQPNCRLWPLRPFRDARWGFQWVRVGGCFPAVEVEALPAHAGDNTSLPVIACPGICGYVLRAV